MNLKNKFSSLLILFFTLSTFGHSAGIVFAESQKEVHCHGETPEKTSFDCCFVSKDFSTEYSQPVIKTIKIPKFFGGDFSYFFQNQESISFGYLIIDTHKKYHREPPPREYTSLVGIIKQLK